MHLALCSSPELHQDAIFALSPQTAISLLMMGVVTRLSVSEKWCRSCDQNYQVLCFLEQGVKDKQIPMVVWNNLDGGLKIQHILSSLDKYCLQRGLAPEISNDALGYAADCGLNRSQTFEKFICSAGNSAAYSYGVLSSISEHKDRNPLLIIGPQGCGKSHLLNAIGLDRLKYRLDTKLLKIEATKFRDMHEVSNQLFSLELLLIENLQEIAHDSIAQENIRVAGNSLISIGCQIVLSFRSGTHELNELNDRTLEFLAHGVSIADKHQDIG